MGYAEVQFPNGNAVRITDGIPLQLGKLSWCDGCQCYKPTDFGQTITNESETVSILWMCADCHT